ncbi:MAG: DUF3300 domain-containing protein [Deltaproteobacteria bacterium]|nr:DUF3300 domain-containing protein [Deltaproteobacteria bacterium]
MRGTTKPVRGTRRSRVEVYFLLSACAALLLASAGCDKGSGTSATSVSDPAPAEVDAGAQGDLGGTGPDDGQAGQAPADGSDVDSRSDAPPPEPTFTRERLEQMVAPLALYPDPLLMQILMAATYPVEVVEADAWLRDNPDLKGEQLDAAVREQDWDDAVVSLIRLPQVIKQLSADLDWTRDLGEAFLGQKDDLLNAVQTMRLRACELGNLATTAEQKVIIDPAPPVKPSPAPRTVVVVPPPPQVVRIVPVSPGVIYVPVYSPVVVYGPPPPTIYYPGIVAYSAGYVTTGAVVSFGIGLAVGAAIWGDLDWHSHRIYRNRYPGGYYGGRDGYYDVSRREPWRHDAWHRRGLDYRSPYVRHEYQRRDAERWREGARQTRPRRSDSLERFHEHARRPPRDYDTRRRGGGSPRDMESDRRAGPPSHGGAPDRRGEPSSRDKSFGRPGGPPSHSGAPDRRGGPSPRDKSFGRPGGPPSHGGAPDRRGGPSPRDKSFGKPGGPPSHGNSPDRRSVPPPRGETFKRPGGPPSHGGAPDRRDGPPSRGMGSDSRAPRPQHGSRQGGSSSGSHGSGQHANQKGDSKGGHGPGR